MNTRDDLEVITDPRCIEQIKGLPFAHSTRIYDLKVGDVIVDNRLGFEHVGVVTRVTPAFVDLTVACHIEGAWDADVRIWKISPLTSLDQQLAMPAPDWQNKRLQANDETIVLRGVVATQHKAATWDVDVQVNGWRVIGNVSCDLAHAFDRTFTIVLEHASVI